MGNRLILARKYSRYPCRYKINWFIETANVTYLEISYLNIVPVDRYAGCLSVLLFKTLSLIVTRTAIWITTSKSNPGILITMATTQKYVTVNSALLFVIASITTMTLHEFGHFVAAILVHAKQISLHHNNETNIDAGLPLIRALLIKGAGPLVSLITGLLFHYLCSRQTTRNMLFLFKLYMSAFGYIGFFGYLMIAPVFQDGDTGYIFHALGLPLWLTIIIAVIGAFALFFIINTRMKYFVEMGSKQIIADHRSRRSFMDALLIYPLAIGIVITTLLNLPMPAFISLISPICSPFTFLWGYGSAFYKKYDTGNYNKDFKSLNKIKPWLFVFFILVVIVNRLLVPGIYLN
jgi:hypothetical protein